MTILNREALPDTLRTTRLLLRPWALDDAGDVLAYAGDKEWGQYLHLIPFPYERLHAEQFVARQLLLDRVTHPSWALVVDDPREGRVAGGVNMRFDFEHRLGTIGYSIARRHWNRGYMTEAVKAVIRAAFTAYPDLNRIRAFADLRNRPSQRVMEKVGMTREGVLRQNRVERGVLMDEVWFGILRGEWEGGGEEDTHLLRPLPAQG